MRAGMGERMTEATPRAALLAERTRRIPLGRRADPATVAEAAIWPVGDAPAYIVAERLNISGGLDRD